MTSKFELTQRYNKQAWQEVRAAGTPRREGSFFIDPEQVWDVSEEEIEAFIEIARKKRRSLKRKTRTWAKDSYYCWLCRQAVMHGLEIRWY